MESMEGEKLVGREVNRPVSGVSVCGCTGSQTQTLLPENQWASVPRACTKIFNAASSCPIMAAYILSIILILMCHVMAAARWGHLPDPHI